jgi:ADP-heptose:LPS heptosyltransferase
VAAGEVVGVAVDCGIERILIVALGRIGDLVLTTPVLPALRARFPAARIDYLAGRHNCEILDEHPLVDRVHVHAKTVRGTLALIAALRAARYDLWIDPKDHHSRESRLFVALAEPSLSAGYDRDGERRHFSVAIPHEGRNRELHAASRALLPLQRLGIPGGYPRPVLGNPQAAARRFERFLSARGIGRFAVVNISANRDVRTWPEPRWAELLSMRLMNLPVLLVAAPQHREAATRLARVGPDLHVYPTPSIIDVLPAIRQATFLVTGDTSLVHIASACDTPIIALYANWPTEFAKYRPLSSRQIVLQTSGFDQPVAGIPVNRVAEAVRQLQDLPPLGMSRAATVAGGEERLSPTSPDTGRCPPASAVRPCQPGP